MKRHDATGPNAVHPAHQTTVILWLDGGSWTEGYWDAVFKKWCVDILRWTEIVGVIAWSDPTEADAGGMVPVWWMICAPQFDGWELRNVYRSKKIAENSALAFKFPVEIVPIYATPPDTAAPAWMPIETAPKTSKARLVWVPENKCIFCVSWADPTGWQIFGGGWREHLQRATHWMPLPAAPGESAPTVDHAAPIEMAAEFTDTSRAALLWVLWHHQGGSSPVGQPLRFALGMGAHEPMNEHQVNEARRWATSTRSTTAEFHADHTAVMRQAVEALIPFSDDNRRVDIDDGNRVRAALAALRGALGDA